LDSDTHIAMTVQTFAERVRLGGIDRFVLWQSAFDFDVPSRILRDEAGRIPIFMTRAEALDYAVARDLSVGIYSPGIDPTTDLDAITAWATNPEAARLDRVAIVHAWMFLADAEVVPGMSDDGLDAALERVVSQLDFADMASSDPERFAHLAPEWTAEELALLGGTLLRGVEQFASVLTSPHAV
jgi:hypothetical protein